MKKDKFALRVWKAQLLRSTYCTSVRIAIGSVS